ncbi:hypothetical protein GQF56_16115 [Rhodobacter sphaeroides]|uniref:Uncharacterized protein n=1 Tax=Cereibacter sphaeroides (strain ATCC 17023 / DSM 158 / JCM 6121 / CCUG 31486 / LMG 2827 / NBRC 12203 / NCIMB 8253 / ATH 2.4.1.) TaxID=272943 RepID=Q3IW48_CERS4|nr:hypothetical protein [Cereibacter sphaeroides]ABA81236.1 hypothetical protein RSP_6193 [Cereibacter sphaeroides 2.4.1]AMJ49539.1 hypothetical protein APX01_18485 [Cereibacter sphaeroides]ANS36252.1 hypothetical protein A3858_18490 [Cereibacter sphaeroides]ATN65308.1 hypothetical protein A3857_18510 [Cereibacter sphaeroides]AXC63530.1 hypothetical protein DQL45_19305 [Cereibacter sphaeroides 2.4.1]
MELVFNPITIAFGVAFLIAVSTLVFLKTRRRRGGNVALIGIFAAVVALIAAAALFKVERDARAAGFESWSDRRAAAAAGITDPQAWKQNRADAESATVFEDPERIAAEREQAEAAEAERQKAEAKEAAERRFAPHCLNPQDGSHPEFVSAVKARLRNPDSFEHLETRVLEVDEEGRNTVVMGFWMRDRFGEKKMETAFGSFSNKTCGSLDVQFWE